MHNRRLLTRSFHNWKESKFYYKSVIIDTTDTKADLFYLWKTVAMEEMNVILEKITIFFSIELNFQ